MRVRRPVAALNLAGGFLCISAAYLGLLVLHEFDAEEAVTVSDIELGTVWQRQACSAHATIENRSRRVLRILDVRASCGCTDINLQTDTLAGHASGALRCQIHTGRMTGRVSKPVTVVWQHEGDDTPSTTVFHLNLTVQPDYSVTPSGIEVSRMYPSTHEVAVRFREPLSNKRVVKVSAPNPAFSTRIASSVADVTTIEIGFDPRNFDVQKPRRPAILINFEGVAERVLALPVTIRDN